MSQKRIFLAFTIDTPPIVKWGKGRSITCLHITIAFLGNISEETIQKIKEHIPKPLFQIAPRGWFDKILFIPEKMPKLVAWHVHWLDNSITKYQKEVVDWLKKEGISQDERPWLSHVTIARDIQDKDEWDKWFVPRPCYAKALHLFESLGDSQYQSLWSYEFVKPFVEIEHTADVAFHIYGTDFEDLYHSAFTALAFKDPFFEPIDGSYCTNLDDVIIKLNDVLRIADTKEYSSFKAVSFHGSANRGKDGILEWEMIVDV